jgi:DNA-binding transcriptional ArsR family regulator
VASLFDSEAGLVAIAHELKKLSGSIYALQLVASLMAGPQSYRDLTRIRPVSAPTLRQWLDRLEEEGILTERWLSLMRRNRKTGSFRTKGRIRFYFLADPFIAGALHEAADFIRRRLDAQAAEARGLVSNLDALRNPSWAQQARPRLHPRKKAKPT